jgi:hypothetical protein
MRKVENYELCVVNSGKAAATAERMNEFDAIADAAYGLYASTKKVKVEEYANTLSGNVTKMVSSDRIR